MKKRIVFFSTGGHALVEGVNVSVQVGNSAPIGEVELDMDDKEFKKMVNNPKKYKEKIARIAGENRGRLEAKPVVEQHMWNENNLTISRKEK